MNSFRAYSDPRGTDQVIIVAATYADAVAVAGAWVMRPEGLKCYAQGPVSPKSMDRIPAPGVLIAPKVARCPDEDCNGRARLQSDVSTDWYGILRTYRCPKCRTSWISQSGGELEMAATNF